MGFPIRNHPFSGSPIYGNRHIDIQITAGMIPTYQRILQMAMFIPRRLEQLPSGALSGTLWTATAGRRGLKIDSFFPESVAKGSRL